MPVPNIRYGVYDHHYPAFSRWLPSMTGGKFESTILARSVIRHRPHLFFGGHCPRGPSAADLRAERGDTHADASIAQVDISALRALAPDVLVIDIDRLDTNPIEAIRQLRFRAAGLRYRRLYQRHKLGYPRACHNAGANCLLLENLRIKAQLATGLRRAMWSGCLPTHVSFRRSSG